MPRIDPLKLLTCLKVLLAPNGGIRSANEVKRLAELMAKYSKKLVSKCIYIQILKSTDTELLGKFMGVGGWLLTHMWLNEGIKAANWPLVQEILELLLLCPVDVQRLRSNTAPKLVKGLSKDGGNEGVRILATKLVEQWLKVVKGETMATGDGTQTTPAAGANGITAGATSGGVIPATGAKTSDQSSQPAPIGDATNVSPSKAKSDDAATYKLIVKDGKQILTKIVTPTDQSGGDDGVEKGDASGDGTTDDKHSNKENEAHSGDSDAKDRDSEKDKSRSSKDKDRHRDHKSSSSSSRHKSSSSKSSSSKNTSSSSSSSKSKSSSHSSSSSSKHKDKDSEKDRHKSSSSKSSSSSSSKDKDKERDKSKSSRDKDRDREKSRSSSDKDRSRSDRDKEKEREKSDKDKSRDESSSSRDRDISQSPTEFDKSSPMTIDKLGKIPKKPKEDEPLVTSIVIPSKKASMSIEIRRDANRPKTVKTYNSQFRSHGLSEEAPPPPSRKGLKKPPPQSIPGTSIPSNLVSKRPSPPPPSLPTTPPATPAAKELLIPPAEKKLKIDLTTAPATEKPGAVKFIAPKPKPSTLVESDMFMDALSAAAPKKDVRKRKRRSSSSKEPGKEPTTPEDPESPIANKVAPLKFYQDTLEESDKLEIGDGNEDFDDKKEDEDDIPLKKVKEQIEEKVREEKELEERRMRETEEPEENPVKKPPGPGCGPDGPPGVLMLHRRKGPKKKLTWRVQEQLEEVRYFELDENERVNVTKTFTDMKNMERFNEREAFMLARKLNADDVMVEQTPWVPLVEVDDVPPHPEGMQSKEKKIQMERELTTLKALYFNRHMIPESPSEPDMEQYQMTDAAVIPLDDITGNPDAVNDFTSMPWPDPKGSPPPDDDFMGGDMGFPGGQFNPFMPFGGGGGWMGPGMNNGPPNGLMPPMGGPMGNFNPMMGGPGSNMMMNAGPPPNMMMGDDMGMNCNMNMMNPGMMGPGGPGGPNFGGMGGGFNNFGPPMGMNPNAMNMNMNNGPPRGGGGGGPRGGNWRSGTAGPPGGMNDGPGGGNWRGGGRGGGPGGNNQRRGGGGPGGGRGDNNRGICKQFQRGFCRNGNKCNFFHPPGGNQRF